MPDYYDAASAASLTVAAEQSHLVLAAVPGSGIRQISIQPDLELDVAPPAGTGVSPGSAVEFAITATNQGPFDATGVQLEASLPAGTTATSVTGDASTCVILSNVVTCTVGILRTDGAATIRVRTTPSTVGALAIDARVTGAQPDSVTGNNSASASASVTERPPASNSGGGGGGGSFDAIAALALLWMFLLRRGRGTRKSRVPPTFTA
jgi:uncharacterized repeat protein (TIGR01451 family)